MDSIITVFPNGEVQHVIGDELLLGFLNVVESWTILEAVEKRIKTFEMWVDRRILQIPWTNYLSNNELLNQKKWQRQDLYAFKKLKLEYFHNIMRNENKDRFLQNIILDRAGRVEVQRSGIYWLANLHQWYRANSTKLFRCTANQVLIVTMI